MQEPVCASKKQLDCVESLKIDTSNCLKPCSGLLVTSFSKSDVHVHSKSLNLLPINKKYNDYKKLTQNPPGILFYQFKNL